MALTLALLCLGSLLLLAIPIHLRVAVERDPGFESRAKLSWLFGLVRVRLHPSGKAKRQKGAKARRDRRPGERPGRFAKRLGRRVLRADLRARSARFLGDLLRALRPRDLRLQARIGLEDPADTGMLWAAMGPLGGWLPCSDIRLEPDFEQERFQLQASGRIRLIPLQVIWLALAFVLSPPIVRAVLAR